MFVGQVSAFDPLTRQSVFLPRVTYVVVRCLSVTFVYCVETAKATAMRIGNQSFRMVPFSMILSDLDACPGGATGSVAVRAVSLR